LVLGEHPKPASLNEVITDSGGESAKATEAKPDSQPGRNLSSSACIPYQDVDRITELLFEATYKLPSGPNAIPVGLAILANMSTNADVSGL